MAQVVDEAQEDRALGGDVVAREQDRAGLVGFDEVLAADRDRYAAEDAVAAARSAVVANWAALQKALGGGWVPPAGPTYTPEKSR